jgi:putative PEP-CTERM system histidine kinase
LYPYKYDYREEWLRFIKTASLGEDSPHFYLNTIKSISQIIDSPGGMLWLKQRNGFFECVESFEMPCIKIKEPSESPLPKFLDENEFVISIDEFKDNPEVYNRLGFLELPSWVKEVNPWLIVPLIHIDKLIGFIVLDHSKAHKKHFNWEDSDLLKTVARQAASLIVQLETSEELAEARQFESFNKLSTYIVHDIKNLITQLSLITTNAERHKNNPLFMDDVITTIANSVDKMNTMMGILRGKEKIKPSSVVNIVGLLEELVISRESSGDRPLPTLGCESQRFYVKADRDQLLSIFGHLVQNAQDATPDDGSIEILQTKKGDSVIVEIIDTGCGMEEGFMKTELFKPFKSTKGDKGMGIGVYEAREIISILGGEIEVTSEPKVGTCFRVCLPGADIST